MADIVLLASKGSTNFVGWQGKVYAVPQSLGPCNDATWNHPQVRAFDTIDQAQAAFPDGAPSAPAPQQGHYPLRQLEGKLYKVVTVITQEIERDGPKWQYAFRDDDGHKFMWGPRPYRYEFHPVGSVAEADEVHFLCPLCFAKNGGSKGTHHVGVTFANRNVPEDVGSRDSSGKPSRWNASGNTIDDLVLTPSIQLDAGRAPDKGCHWHGFVGSNGIPPGCAG